MKTQNISNTTLKVSRIGYGCMNLGDSRDAAHEIDGSVKKEALKSINIALEEGINLFDHADIYARGKSERVFSFVLSEISGLRDRIIIQTKCGIRFAGSPQHDDPGRYDFSYKHIINSVENSLKRLQVEYIDILLLHRPDPLVEPDEVAKAFDELQEKGKVRYFGVSNHTGAQIELLKKSVNQQLVINQMELNILHSDLINAGVVTNQRKPEKVLRGEGTLEYCRLKDIAMQAWSPLAKGTLSGNIPDNAEENIKNTAKLITQMAQEKGVSREAIIIAWLLRHPAQIQPIIGTRNPVRIKAVCEADNIELSREEWYKLFIAGRGEFLP